MSYKKGKILEKFFLKYTQHECSDLVNIILEYSEDTKIWDIYFGDLLKN